MENEKFNSQRYTRVHALKQNKTKPKTCKSSGRYHDHAGLSCAQVDEGYFDQRSSAKKAVARLEALLAEAGESTGADEDFDSNQAVSTLKWNDSRAKDRSKKNQRALPEKFKVNIMEK